MLNVASSPSRSSTSKPAALSTGTLLAACTAVFIATVGMGLPAAITGVMQTLHVSGPQLSWINAVFLVPTATLGLTFGVLGDLYGRKRILVGGAALMAIGYAVAAIGVSVHALYVGQALSGIGAAALFASSLASITAATPGAAARARGLDDRAVRRRAGRSRDVRRRRGVHIVPLDLRGGGPVRRHQ
ncbi:MFS transporter [Streptomyces canus]|uniref:MFS transporter n=1 Tax=Streptomyces canus TaxID=58343 RepID=UPI002E3413AA|nr:MFS transporter [Streptomyces canus]